MQANENDRFVIWNVYEKPVDYPEDFVARKFVIGGSFHVATNEMFVADTLAEVRALLPRGLVRIARAESDDPKIVESWL